MGRSHRDSGRREAGAGAGDWWICGFLEGTGRGAAQTAGFSDDFLDTRIEFSSRPSFASVKDSSSRLAVGRI